MMNLKVTVLFVVALIYTQSLKAQDSTKIPQKVNIHFQTTYIYQFKPSFHSPYANQNSLQGKKEEQNSLTATLYIGVKLWKGGEFYLNPELAGGSALSGAFGLAGSSNGETYRVGNPSPSLYLARGYIKQTFGFGNGMDTISDAANQLSTIAAKKNVSFYLGKYSMADFLDNNQYTNSARTQFLNWALINNGAWDYAANVRGYTYALTTIVQLDKMSYRLGIATMPKEANGPVLNTNFKDSFGIGINAEIGRHHQLSGKAGNIRIIGYFNTANMGSYNEALKLSATPDIIATRKLGRKKAGILINFDQELSKYAGVFVRAGLSDGKNETWAYTEIDETITAGFSFKGSGWKRKEDNAGVAVIISGLSKGHKAYLQNGGLGFELGDGRLNYGAESIVELYYNWKPLKEVPIWFSGDYQFVVNPGYNKDRGPVHIFSIRFHTDF